MRAINHAVTGALIGLVVGNPAVAMPLALMSHFVCDVIPHHGENHSAIASKRFAILLLVDALLCFILVAILAIAQPQHWLLACVCAFVATLPDFAWLPGYIRVRKHQPYKSLSQSGFMLWAAKIQWFERPIGAVVEAAWLIGGVILLYPFVYGSY